MRRIFTIMRETSWVFSWLNKSIVDTITYATIETCRFCEFTRFCRMRKEYSNEQSFSLDDQVVRVEKTLCISMDPPSTIAHCPLLSTIIPTKLTSHTQKHKSQNEETTSEETANEADQCLSRKPRNQRKIRKASRKAKRRRRIRRRSNSGSRDATRITFSSLLPTAPTCQWTCKCKRTSTDSSTREEVNITRLSTWTVINIITVRVTVRVSRLMGLGWAWEALPTRDLCTCN